MLAMDRVVPLCRVMTISLFDQGLFDKKQRIKLLRPTIKRGVIAMGIEEVDIDRGRALVMEHRGRLDKDY